MTLRPAVVGAADFGFRNEYRLHKANEFSSVITSRRVLRGDRFDLHYRPDTGKHAGARLGLIIAKKLAPKAVQRNLIKRLAREAFRHIRAKLPDYDLVVRLARPVGDDLGPVARRAWRADLERLFARLPVSER